MLRGEIWEKLFPCSLLKHVKRGRCINNLRHISAFLVYAISLTYLPSLHMTRVRMMAMMSTNTQIMMIIFLWSEKINRKISLPERRRVKAFWRWAGARAKRARGHEREWERERERERQRERETERQRERQRERERDRERDRERWRVIRIKGVRWREKDKKKGRKMERKN